MSSLCRIHTLGDMGRSPYFQAWPNPWSDFGLNQTTLEASRSEGPPTLTPIPGVGERASFEARYLTMEKVGTPIQGSGERRVHLWTAVAGRFLRLRDLLKEKACLEPRPNGHIYSVTKIYS